MRRESSIRYYAGGTSDLIGPSLFVLDSTTQLFTEIEVADAAPTAATKDAVADLDSKAPPLMDAWQNLLKSDLPALNQQLKQCGFQKIKTEFELVKP